MRLCRFCLELRYGTFGDLAYEAISCLLKGWVCSIVSILQHNGGRPCFTRAPALANVYARKDPSRTSRIKNGYRKQAANCETAVDK